MKPFFGIAAAVFIAAAAATASSPDIKDLVRAINAVGPEGAGGAEAARAWAVLSRRPAGDLPQLLEAFDAVSPMAANWLATAVDAVVERQKAARQSLPVADLETFLRDVSHSDRGRRIAFELVCDVDPAAKKRLLPTMLNDPGAELRYEAVANAFATVKSQPLESAAAAAEVRRLFDAVRDPRQVEEIAQEIERRGQKVDLVAHFGFITRWQVVGVFDNTDGRGYGAAYPPDDGVRLSDTYRGKDGAESVWRPVAAGKQGFVDLNAVFPDPTGKRKGRAAAVAYAYAEVESPQESRVQVRASSATAIKVSVNGREVLARELYHQNFDRDLLTAPALLRRGRNTILVKVCQNEQPEPFAQNWMFQLRLTDALGAKVPVKVVSPGFDRGSGE
jgi:hypothetical protein